MSGPTRRILPDSFNFLICQFIPSRVKLHKEANCSIEISGFFVIRLMIFCVVFSLLVFSVVSSELFSVVFFEFSVSSVVSSELFSVVSSEHFRSFLHRITLN